MSTPALLPEPQTEPHSVTYTLGAIMLVVVMLGLALAYGLSALAPRPQLEARRREQACEQRQGRLLTMTLDSRHRRLWDAGSLGQLPLCQPGLNSRQANQVAGELLTVLGFGRTHRRHTPTIANMLSSRSRQLACRGVRG